MKTKLFILSLLFLSGLYFCQSLSYKLIEQIKTTSFTDYDKLLVVGYGFYKLEDNGNDSDQFFERKYISRGNDNNSLFIHIAKDNNYKKPIIMINFGNDISVENLKTELITNGYEYNGERDVQSSIYLSYQKNKEVLIISKHGSKKGIKQLVYFPEQ